MVKTCQQLLKNLEHEKGLYFHKRNEKQSTESELKSPVSLFTQASDKFSNKLIKRTSSKKSKIPKPIRAEGHRGCGILYAENSIQSFTKGIQAGLDSVELDVWLSKDQQLIVVHGKDDDTLTLQDGSSRKIIDMTYKELVELFIIKDDQKIPLLKEVLELCYGKCRVNIEIKGSEPDLCLRILELCIECKMLEHIHISSFLHFHQKHLQSAVKLLNLGQNQIQFGYLIWLNEDLDSFDSYEHCGNILAFPARFLYDTYTLPFLFKAKERGMQLAVYFDFDVKETHQIYKRVFQAGIDTIITNQPHFLVNYLKKGKKN